MAWPDQCLWICTSQLRADSRFAPSQWDTVLHCSDVSRWLGASLESALQLHQVCNEVLPHRREGGWRLNAVLRECLHAFHHYQLYDGLASMWSRHHEVCVVSPLLFVMCMELILRGTTDITSGEETGSGGVLLPSGAFMDDKTTLVHSKVGTQELLDRFHDLFTWARMKAKPKKRRSMPLIRGTVCDINFHKWIHPPPHGHGATSQESRQVICLPTHRQTQRSRDTEDCLGDPSRHWEEWASWEAQGMVSYPASCGPCRSTRFPSPGLKLSNSTPTSTFASGWVCPLLLNSWPLYHNRNAPAPLLVHHRSIQGWKS